MHLPSVDVRLRRMTLRLTRRLIGRWLIVLGAMLAVMGAAWWLNHQQPLYRSRALVIVGPLSGTPTNDEETLRRRYAETYLQLLKRPQVLQVTLDKVGSSLTPDELGRMINVSLIPNTQLLEIAVTAPDEVLTRAFADELANQLIAVGQQATPGVNTVFLQKQIADLQMRLTTMRADLQDLTTQIANSIDLARLQTLRTQRSDLVFQITLLEQNYAALSDQLSKATHDVSIVILAEAASMPVRVAALPSAGILIIAAAVGALFGGVAGWLLQTVDRTFGTTKAVQESLGIRALAAVPLIRSRREDDKLIHRQPEGSYYVEPFHALRDVLLSGTQRIMIVTSAQSGEGKSLVTANLGIALAQSGQRVLIVDADLRAPVQHRLFKLNNRDGLTSLVYAFASGGSIEDAANGLKHIESVNLSVLTSGPLPANPDEILESAQLLDLVHGLAVSFDFVLIDMPAILAAPEVLTPAPHVDGLLFVIAAQHTRRRFVQQTVQHITDTQAVLLGAVLNRARLQSRGAELRDRSEARTRERRARTAEPALESLESPPGQTEQIG